MQDKVYVPMNRLIFSQLRFNFIEPVDKSLQRVCELTWEQQSLLQLVLPVEWKKHLLSNSYYTAVTRNPPFCHTQVIMDILINTSQMQKLL